MFSENLQKLRKNLQLSQNDFALKLGMNPRAYVNYERGERKPPFELLIDLSNDFNVNLNWLINDKGNMFNQPELGDIENGLELQVVEIMRKYGVVEK